MCRFNGGVGIEDLLAGRSRSRETSAVSRETSAVPNTHEFFYGSAICERPPSASFVSEFSPQIAHLTSFLPTLDPVVHALRLSSNQPVL